MGWWAICKGWSKLVHLLTPCLRIRTQNSRSCKWHSPFVTGCKLWFRRVPLAWSNDLVCSRRWTASFIILDMLITIPRIAKYLNVIRSSQPLIALQSWFLRSFLNSCWQLQIWSRVWDEPKCLRATCSCKLVFNICENLQYQMEPHIWSLLWSDWDWEGVLFLLQNSKFLQFVSKMSRGELIVEDNQVKPSQQSSGDDWAQQFEERHAAEFTAGEVRRLSVFWHHY